MTDVRMVQIVYHMVYESRVLENGEKHKKKARISKNMRNA